MPANTKKPINTSIKPTACNGGRRMAASGASARGLIRATVIIGLAKEYAAAPGGAAAFDDNAILAGMMGPLPPGR